LDKCILKKQKTINHFLNKLKSLKDFGLGPSVRKIKPRSGNSRKQSRWHFRSDSFRRKHAVTICRNKNFAFTGFPARWKMEKTSGKENTKPKFLNCPDSGNPEIELSLIENV